ncbi:MAG: rhodanese-like domain-containing protein [Alphaproteobacteria bacterium]|nr:rhodanese-like domain-containing protein [Alphaproteobacteria bacterium]
MDQIDISPQRAWKILQSTPEAVLIDVRTEPEWLFVGVPDPEGLGKTLLRICWQIYPAMERNPRFVEQLREAGVQEDQTLLLICRSGIRSKAAALLLREQGFAASFNIEGGFEGNLDEKKQRGIGGWKSTGLPWRQS